MNFEEKTALIYCRVSTDSQEENGTSLDSQEKECVKHADSLGYKVKKIVKEAYSAAYLHDRPLLTKERERIERGEYDAVIVYAVDRLSRNSAHLYILKEEFVRAGTALISVTDTLDESPEGKMLQMMKGVFAEIEREKIRERCLRGKRTVAQNGKLIAATDLYGYETDRENKVRIIKESEACIVRRIFQEYLNGNSIRGIIKGLNDDGIPSAGSNKRRFKKTDHYTNLSRYGRTLWGRGAVNRILKEPAYCGKSFSFRYKAIDGYERDKKSGEIKRFHRIGFRPKEEWIQLPDNVTPAIVTTEIFQAVQEKLASRVSVENTRNEEKPILLRGLVICGTCKRKMYPETERGERNIFRCPSRYIENCGGKRINADKCEVVVWEKIADIIRNPQTIALELERRKNDGDNERETLKAEIDSIRNLITSIEVDIKRIVSRFGTIEDDFIFEALNEQLKFKKQERDGALVGMAEAERQLKAFDANIQGFENLINFSNRVAENLDNLDFDAKRVALQALNVKVIGNGKNIKLKYSFPIEKQDIKTNHSDDWLARLRQNDACKTLADDSAAARIRRSAGNYKSSFRRRFNRKIRLDCRETFSQSASHDFRRRIDWRRCDSASGRSLSGAQRRFVSGRAAGI